MRNTSTEAQRDGEADSPFAGVETRPQQLGAAAPALIAVLALATICAILWAIGDGQTGADTIFYVLSVPLLMALVGSAWSTHKAQFSAGISAALATGVVMSLLFLAGLVI